MAAKWGLKVIARLLVKKDIDIKVKDMQRRIILYIAAK